MDTTTMDQLDQAAAAYGKGKPTVDRAFNQAYAEFVASFWRRFDRGEL